MEFEISDPQIIEEAGRRGGIRSELSLMIEECSELIKELVKYMNRGHRNKGKILEEIADVYIVLYGVANQLGMKDVNRIIEKKLIRLKERLWPKDPRRYQQTMNI